MAKDNTFEAEFNQLKYLLREVSGEERNKLIDIFQRLINRISELEMDNLQLCLHFNKNDKKDFLDLKSLSVMASSLIKEYNELAQRKK